jgi:uncharacterized membrane protein
MPKVSVRVDLPGQDVAAAQRLWFDLARWPNFIDGFGAVARVDAGWPAPGATLVWDSRPNGRGRVIEVVTAYEPSGGQTAEVEDSQLRGTQQVAFALAPAGAQVALSLDYSLKRSGPLRAVVDVFFIRRALSDSLRRTLVRFKHELAGDADLVRSAG